MRTLVLWIWMACCASGTWQLAAAPNVTETFFASAEVRVLKIEIAAEDQEILKRSPRTAVRATVREGEKVYREVAVHLKGSKLGSFRPLEGKPSFTLNFDKFVDGQSFHGMDKVYLNNSVEDPTYMDEDLGGHFFRAAGVPAPRTAHVVVELGPETKGLYVLKQGFDRAWLKQVFEHNRGNLYEGGAREDITASLKKDAGDKTDDRDDLDALVKAAQESDPARRWDMLRQILDVDRFVSFAALEVVLCHWDGYCLNQNNYRLYADPGTGKFVFIPHGMDILFEEPESEVHPQWKGMVAKGLMSTPEGLRAYDDKLADVVANVVRPDELKARIAMLEARIGPALEATERERFTQAVAELRENVTERFSFLRQSLPGLH